ncbi:heavy metal-responsive transcriptional regulator [Pseudoxanthomonas suwonensis]|uniref:MerR family transcriptional regulator n=1 Tax=Pseudoxanthomonas suwonensis TaxID=314722 RepID=A0A0E3Z258_9GAMM|nr:heavy metal-responsive transcriptional regulator [Pseudoxanthomonas suwonensis]AKC87088.1 MerR family transcriptional regulator [Pseudoxanthomonas suwonensis]
MKIGELARKAGVNIDTVRYYERQGLLPPARRLASGYREYAEADLRRLRFVRQARALGFTLEDIGELLSLSSRGDNDMAGMKATAAARLADVDARIAELARIRDALRSLVDACPGHGSVEGCPILRALAEKAA